jgi:DNA-binding winged helix-turn-helix (wHTH) protein/tetratricopeptide (TPR) repeat protein
MFELDPQTGELRKNGTRVRLQDQPLKVLRALLEEPGAMVSRDELKGRIWPEENFGDFDHAVNVAVAKIRVALADSADTPRYVETLPRRGYRFIFPVTQPETPESQTSLEIPPPAAAPAAETHGFPWRAASGAALAAVAMAISAWWFISGRPRHLTDQDTIVLADFANNTGDPVFDGTLRQGLSVQLAQSPFLSLVSDKQIQQTLQMMKQPAGAKVTPAVASEVCRRNGSTAIVNGSIAQIGTQYSLILKAEDCSNGKVIAGAEALAADKSHVLDALEKASASLRKKFGESLTTLEKFDTPLEQATTASLQALQAYDAGCKLADKGDFAGALPFFKQARNLDANFAMASLLLGMMQNNLVHPRDGASNLQRAFDQRWTVSEQERLFIEVEYYQTKGGQEAQDALHVSTALWVKTYPRDCTAHSELGALYGGEEQFDKALPEMLEAHHLCPGDGLISAGLINVYKSLNRFAEARAVAEEPRVKDVDSFEVHSALYRLDFLQNDTAGMEREVAFAAGKPGLEDQLWYFQANAAAYYGRMKDSREFSRKAVASAFEAGENERAVLDAEVAALREAYVGNMTEARRQLSAALRLPGAANAGSWIVLDLLARLGEEGRFKPLAEKYAKENADDPYVQNMQLPAWMAELALARHDAPAALEVLRPRPYESRFHCPDTTYVRGLAYLANRQGKEAAAEFQKMIDYRVLLDEDPESSLAHLQMGRAFALQGDTARARAAYQDFLALWKDADPDIPIFQQAKAEFAKLH